MKSTRPIEIHAINSVTDGRDPCTDQVNEAMNQLADSLLGLTGWPTEGTHGPSHEKIVDITMMVETTRSGDHGEQRHPGHTIIFRWWPEYFVPPESKVVIHWKDREGDAT